MQQVGGNVEDAADFLLSDVGICRAPCGLPPVVPVAKVGLNAPTACHSPKDDSPRRAYLDGCLEQGVAPMPIVIARVRPDGDE